MTQVQVEPIHFQIKTAHLLLVDDDAFVLKALELTLKQEGYVVHTALSAKLALEILKQFPVALILSDQRMPEMTGIELLKIAKSMKPEAFRILITGNSELALVKEAVNSCQISQFIEKPWDEALLKRMIRDMVEKYLLQQENKELSELVLENHKELAVAHQALSRDLRLAGKVQETLLLGKIPKHFPGFSIDAMTVASRDVDGDFFEFCHPFSGILDVVIGDVMGKGISAALIGTAIKTQLLRFAVPIVKTQKLNLVKFLEEDLFSPQEILEKVQEEMVEKLIHLEVFVSLFYARFNLQKKSLTYIDCGAMKPIHLSFLGGEGSPKNLGKIGIKLLSGENFPLGFVEADRFIAKKIYFNVGDFFVFYSDGLTDCHSPEGEFFGKERLIEFLKQNCRLTVSELLEGIKKEVFSFSKRRHFEDDLTLIILKIEAHEIPTLINISSAQFQRDLVQLEAVRQFVKRVCEKIPGNTQYIAPRLELAVNEGFCNIVKHGRGHPSHSHVRIDAEILEEGVLFTLSDQGYPFDPQAVLEPNLAGDRDSGFGWYLIKEIVDELQYTPKIKEGGWNHLTLYKQYYFGEESMNIQSELVGDVLVITLNAQNLDAKSAAPFKEKVLQLILEKNKEKIVIDLHQLTFIDSSGLGCFLSILRTLNNQNGELKLAAMNRSVRSIFELVMMHKLFDIFNSREEALTSFNTHSPLV